MSPAGEPVVLGIDLGTTQIKAGLLTASGRTVAETSVGYEETTRPAAGKTEQSPETWWTALREAVRYLGQVPNQIATVCCVGQGPTLVAVDDQGEPVRDAISWMDARASKEQAELAERMELDGFLLGNLPKILWMQRNEPDLYAKSRWFLNPWDYVALRLSGVARTAVSPTGSEVIAELAEQAGLDPALIPSSRRWCTPVGTIRSEVGEELDLAPGTEVVLGANDAVASYVGAALREAGDALNTGGTSGGFSVYWHSSLHIPGVYAIPALVPGLRLFGGAMSATGKSLEWFGETVLGEESFEGVLQAAAQAPPGSGGVVFLPYLVGERSPLWDPEARGAFVGFGVEHDRSHLVRAVLEAAAFAISHVAEPILQAGVEVTEMRVAGSTALADLWNQIKADVTGFRVAVPANVQTATVGAAVLAAVGMGWHASVEAAMASMVRMERHIEPRTQYRDLYDDLFSVYKDLYPALHPSYKQLARLRDST